MSNEIWKDIKNYEGLYQVSNLGKVRNSKGDILYQGSIKGGYKRVQLHNTKKAKSLLVHRLVAEAFIPNPENKPYINHKNSCTTDNTISNLEWCTPSENTIHGYKYGNMKNGNKKRATTCKENFSKKVRQYDLKMNLIKEYESLSEASKANNFSKSNLCRCCNMETQKANGYIWRYVDA